MVVVVVQLVLQQRGRRREGCAATRVADDGVVRHLRPVVIALDGLLFDAGATGRVGVAALEVYGLGHVRQRRPRREARPDVHLSRLRSVEDFRKQSLAELTVVYEVLQVQADFRSIQIRQVRVPLDVVL